MRFNSLNAEQGALLKLLDLPEDISIQEIIESLKSEDKEHFEKSLNEGVVKLNIKLKKINIKI